uniref:Uncharacterized protein n=1 Tax=Onchocerca volvulus TaxID=6282 RepID=A0A8R1XP98_ONCVO
MHFRPCLSCKPLIRKNQIIFRRPKYNLIHVKEKSRNWIIQKHFTDNNQIVTILMIQTLYYAIPEKNESNGLPRTFLKTPDKIAKPFAM